MIYELPKKVFNQTHAYFHEILIVPGQSVKVTGRYGTLPATGFSPQEMIRGPVRRIHGREAEAFFASAKSAAKAAGAAPDKVDFRRSDLRAWLNDWGHDGDGQAWRDANPPAER